MDFHHHQLQQQQQQQQQQQIHLDGNHFIDNNNLDIKYVYSTNSNPAQAYPLIKNYIYNNQGDVQVEQQQQLHHHHHQHQQQPQQQYYNYQPQFILQPTVIAQPPQGAYLNTSVSPTNTITTNSTTTMSTILPPPPQQPQTMPTDINVIKAQLRKQLEYYFSPDNLSKDTFLKQQMDSDNYVPINIIASFNKVRELTQDMNFIIECIRESVFLQLDQTMTKVRRSQKRFILILREIPSTVPKEEIENLFKNEKCPQLYNCEFAGNDNWYITFNNEEQAQRALHYLKEDVQIFLGKPILARLKAHLMPRSSSNTTTLMQQNNTPSATPPPPPSQPTAVVVTTVPQPQQTQPQQLTQQLQKLSINNQLPTAVNTAVVVPPAQFPNAYTEYITVSNPTATATGAQSASTVQLYTPQQGQTPPIISTAPQTHFTQRLPLASQPQQQQPPNSISYAPYYPVWGVPINGAQTTVVATPAQTVAPNNSNSTGQSGYLSPRSSRSFNKNGNNSNGKIVSNFNQPPTQNNQKQNNGNNNNSSTNKFKQQDELNIVPSTSSSSSSSSTSSSSSQYFNQQSHMYHSTQVNFNFNNPQSFYPGQQQNQQPQAYAHITIPQQTHHHPQQIIFNQQQQQQTVTTTPAFQAYYIQPQQHITQVVQNQSISPAVTENVIQSLDDSATIPSNKVNSPVQPPQPSQPQIQSTQPTNEVITTPSVQTQPQSQQQQQPPQAQQQQQPQQQQYQSNRYNKKQNYSNDQSYNSGEQQPQYQRKRYNNNNNNNNSNYDSNSNSNKYSNNKSYYKQYNNSQQQNYNHNSSYQNSYQQQQQHEQQNEVNKNEVDDSLNKKSSTTNNIDLNLFPPLTSLPANSGTPSEYQNNNNEQANINVTNSNSSNNNKINKSIVYNNKNNQYTNKSMGSSGGGTNKKSGNNEKSTQSYHRHNSSNSISSINSNRNYKGKRNYDNNDKTGYNNSNSNSNHNISTNGINNNNNNANNAQLDSNNNNNNQLSSNIVNLPTASFPVQAVSPPISVDENTNSFNGSKKLSYSEIVSNKKQQALQQQQQQQQQQHASQTEVENQNPIVANYNMENNSTEMIA